MAFLEKGGGGLVPVYVLIFPESGETRLRGPEGLGPLKGLGIRPLVSVIGVSETPNPRGPLEPRKKARRASGEAFQGPRRGVFDFNRAGKQGGPLRGLLEAPFSRMPPERVPTLGLLPSGHR